MSGDLQTGDMVKQAENEKCQAATIRPRMNEPLEEKKSGNKLSLSRIILYGGVAFLTISIFMPPSFRDSIASGMNIIILPFTAIMPYYLILLIIAVIVAFCSTIFQKYTVDWEIMRRYNRIGAALNKELIAAQCVGNKARVKEIEKERRIALGDQWGMTLKQLKPVVYIAFVSLPLFWWVYWYVTQPANADMSMTFPFLGAHKLTEEFVILPYWYYWSLICLLAFGNIIGKALNLVTK